MTNRGRFEGIIRVALFACGAVSVLTTVGIVIVLVSQSFGFFASASPLEILTSTRWSPELAPRSFGLLPLLNGTLLVATGAAVIALPTGLGAAIYLSEYASEGVHRLVRPSLEVLAGIPTVVYGYVAIVFVTPVLREIFPSAGVFNAASAALAVGVMILPMVSALSEQALRGVPGSLREAGYALGATKFEVTVKVVLPAAASGIVASFILAFSRAMAETIIVTLVAGGTPRMTLDLLASIQTMTAYIAQVHLGVATEGTVEYHAMFALGLVLFLMTLTLNLISRRLTTRFQAMGR